MRRGRRHRHELDAAAGRRCGGRPRVRRARAAHRRHAARRGRRQRPGASRDEAMERVFGRLRHVPRGASTAHGAERVVAVLTSAVRDAANGAEFQRQLRASASASRRRRSPGEREARLTYPRRDERRARTTSRCSCSTSAAAAPSSWSGRATSVEFFVSTQIGSVRHTERYLHTDPPTQDELAACREAVRDELERAVPANVRGRVRRTASRWPARRPRSPRSTCASSPTTASASTATGSHPRACERILARARRAAAAPSAARCPGCIPTARPRSSPAGDPRRDDGLFGLDAIEVSEHDILEGAALEAAETLGTQPISHANLAGKWIKRPLWAFSGCTSSCGHS